MRSGHFSAAFAALATAYTALAGCTDGPVAPEREPDGRAPTPVVTVPVRTGVARTRIEAVGSARARRSVEIHPEAAGEVVSVKFSAGGHVVKGDVLVELDARDARLALELAEVRLDEARRLARRYETANQRRERTVPETTLDSARSALKAARIERDRAEVALANRSVEAPFDGVVGLTEVDAGDRIAPSTVITTLDDRSALLVRFDVPEAYVGQVEPGDPIEIRMWSAHRKRTNGRIVDVDSRIAPATRAFSARARVVNPNDRLRPGMSFRVSLALEGGRWPEVPALSVLWGGNGAYVWVIDAEGRARRVEVAIVQRGDGRALIDGELSPGDPVVTEGMQRMRAGVAVRAMDAEALARDTRSALAEDTPETGGAQ